MNSRRFMRATRLKTWLLQARILRAPPRDSTPSHLASEGNKGALKETLASLWALERCGLFSRFRLGEFLFELVDPILQCR
jgi:hypothetical protein